MTFDRKQVAELIRCVESMRATRISLINSESESENENDYVVEYNRDLLKLDNELLEKLLNIKKDLKNEREL